MLNAVSIFHKYHSFLSKKCKTEAKQYLNNVTFSRTASIHNLEQCKLKRRIFLWLINCQWFIIHGSIHGQFRYTQSLRTRKPLTTFFFIRAGVPEFRADSDRSELFSSQSESFWKGPAWQSFKTLSRFLLTLPAKRLCPSAQISFLSIMMA